MPSRTEHVARLRELRARKATRRARQPNGPDSPGPSSGTSAESAEGRIEPDSGDIATWAATNWRFLDADRRIGGGYHVLDHPYQAQLEFWQAITESPRVLCLKARGRGWTTAACAAAAKHLLEPGPPASVHVVSREEAAVADFAQRLKDGLLRMGISFVRETERILELSNGSRIEFHPTGKHPARGRYGSLVICDEWSVQEHGKDVFASILGVAPRTWVAFTSQGAGHPSSLYFREAMDGEYEWRTIFMPSDEVSRKEAARTLDRYQLRLEHPLTIEEALAGQAANWYEPADLRRAEVDRQQILDFRKEHARTVIAADFATSDQGDSSSFTVLMMTDPENGNEEWGIVAIVEEVRPERGTSTSEQARILLDLRSRYHPKVPIAVERNGSGIGLIHALQAEGLEDRYLVSSDRTTDPEKRRPGHVTTEASKNLGLSQLAWLLENGKLRYSKAISPGFHEEGHNATKAKGAHIGDSVMSASIGVQYLRAADRIVRRGQGKVHKPIFVDTPFRRSQEQRAFDEGLRRVFGA